MVKLKHSERHEVERIFEMEQGYVLDFSNTTFSEFFQDEMAIDIYSDDFSGGGNSKANRLRTLLERSSPRMAGKILRELWRYKTAADRAELDKMTKLAAMSYLDPELVEITMLPHAFEEKDFEDLVRAIEARDEGNSVGEVLQIAKLYNFDTVLDEIERARTFVDDDPEDAITAASSLVESVCRSILVELGEPLPRDLSLSPLYKSVRVPLGLDPGKDNIDPLIANDVRSILSGITATVGAIGALRSHAGDAHGREKGKKRVDARIARLAVNSASTLAVFMIESWNRRYPERDLHNVDAGALS